MATIECFEDIIAWQKAKELAVFVYGITRDMSDYPFKDQLQRAAISVSNNIAEGFERKSNKEFRQFLFIAKGSCGEVRSMLRIGAMIGLVSESGAREAIQLSEEVSKITSGLIKRL